MNTSYRILANGIYANNDTWITGLNNNDLIIGPSGAGKTRGYVKPNIMQCNESMIIADTKGSLIDEVGPVLKQNGYKVIHLDFKNLRQSYGYNPLDYIRYDKSSKHYRSQDIITIATALVGVTSKSDPFWEYAARMYLTTLIAYVMECLPKKEHSLKYVVDLFSEIGTGNFRKLMSELKTTDPDSLAVRTYKLFEATARSERTEASITSVLGEKLNGLVFDDAMKMYSNRKRICFQDIGCEKTAVFLTISDTDRSMDRMISLFYTQALQTLCYSADTQYPDHRLPVPVRFILDDFATNAYIPDFQNIISVIRSREIYVSIILQNLTQLNALYGDANASTIVNNCDNCLYLGGQDTHTAQWVSQKSNLPTSTILQMGLQDVFLLTRGQPVRKVQKYDIRSHSRYADLPEASRPMPSGERSDLAVSLEEKEEGGKQYGD